MTETLQPQVQPIQEVDVELTLAEEAYLKLLPIPEEQWWTGSMHNGDHRKFCALGHIGEAWGIFRRSKFMTYTVAYIREKGMDPGRSHMCIAQINDHPFGPYTQSTPKQRVIAFLEDMIKDGW